MIRVSPSTLAGPSRDLVGQPYRAETNLHEPTTSRFTRRNATHSLCRKFYLKHTLQIFLGQLQFKSDGCGVIQFVTLRLKQAA